MNIRIKRLHPDAVIPKYAKPNDSGFDLVATEDVIIQPGETALVPTGLAFEIPTGYELQVRPRSGVSLKTKLRVANSPGTVDSSYRGEVKVIIDNIAMPSFYMNETYMTIGLEFGSRPKSLDGSRMLGVPSDEQSETYIIRKGDRIARGIIAPVVHANLIETDEDLTETSRGSGGFGSSGVKAHEYIEMEIEEEE